MRDKKFVALHRGGSLTLENHKLMMGWAIACTERVLPYYGNELDSLLIKSIQIAKDWLIGKCTTGEAMKVSREVHCFCKTINNPIQYVVVRSIGQCVATAHMSDHCMGAALYAQKTLKIAGKSFEEERSWQMDRLEKLPIKIANMIKVEIIKKGKGLGL